MALHAVTALTGAPGNVLEAIEQAHTALDRTRCPGWLAATGHTADPYQTATGSGPIRVYKVDRPRPYYGCEFHPAGDGDL